MVKLGEFADLDLGKMLDQKKNKGIPRKYLANVDVRWGAFNLANLKEMRFQDSELERYGLKFGDIVMCEGGEPGAKDREMKRTLQRLVAKSAPGQDAPLRTGQTLRGTPEMNAPCIPTQRTQRKETQRDSKRLGAPCVPGREKEPGE